MIKMKKTAELEAANIPFSYLEVSYPARESWDAEAFRAMVQKELQALRAEYSDYDRKAVFGENLYFRFFRKFKKTFPVLLQFESILYEKHPFPDADPLTAAPFLVELRRHVLSGTHDVDRVMGEIELFLGTEKAPFTGLHGADKHTYPGDLCARDEGGIIFSEISGADDRTSAHPDSQHVFYPIFGTPNMPESVLSDALDVLEGYVRVLAPAARIDRAIL